MSHLIIDGFVFEFEGVFFSDKPRRLSGLISCKIVCVAETESDSEATVYYVIGAILYRTLGVILPAPTWVLLVISTPQLVRFLTTSHILFFLCFSRLFLIPTCNSPSVFSLIVSLLLPPRSLCLPSYQTNVLDPPKKHISLDVSLFLLHCHVFLELRCGLRLGAGLMGPETWI